MPTTYEAAYDATTTRFETEWNAGAAAIVGMVPEIRFQGIEKGEIPEAHFCRFSFNPVVEAQSTLRNGEHGQRYTTVGNVIIQVFAYRRGAKPAEVEEYARKLAILARDIFRGKCFTGGIVFRNCRVNRLTSEDKYNRHNVIADFEYDEIG